LKHLGGWKKSGGKPPHSKSKKAAGEPPRADALLPEDYSTPI
jgi:hypothetical protein